MAEPNPRLDRFFQRGTRWRAEIQALRAILLTGPVSEDLHWRQPCYRAHDGNIAIIGGMKDCAFVSFLKGALLAEPDRSSGATRRLFAIGPQIRILPFELTVSGKTLPDRADTLIADDPSIQ